MEQLHLFLLPTSPSEILKLKLQRWCVSEISGSTVCFTAHSYFLDSENGSCVPHPFESTFQLCIPFSWPTSLETLLNCTVTHNILFPQFDTFFFPGGRLLIDLISEGTKVRAHPLIRRRSEAVTVFLFFHTLCPSLPCP